MPGLHTRIAALTALAVGLVGCGAAGRSDAPPLPGGYTKVLVVVEENKTYDQVLGSGRAPYLTGLADTYGSATALDAGFPPKCPSLAAYIILTSGDDHGICDDKPPAKHRLGSDSVFGRVAAKGGEWRVYAESMPAPCSRTDSPDGRYAVRHNPATYYTKLGGECPKRVVPMGTPEAGSLHDDLRAGRLPELSMVVPDICDDMHGGEPCSGDAVGTGDEWLHHLLSQIMAAPDYAAGRLVVVITWDEGTEKDNHIPTVVISPTTLRRKVDTSATLCSVLGLVSQVLAVKPLGCADSAPRLAAPFGL